MKWWTSNEKRTVLAVWPVDEHTVQVIRKGPFLVECAVIVDGEAVAVFGCWACVVAGQWSGSESSYLWAGCGAA